MAVLIQKVMIDDSHIPVFRMIERFMLKLLLKSIECFFFVPILSYEIIKFFQEMGLIHHSFMLQIVDQHLMIALATFFIALIQHPMVIVKILQRIEDSSQVYEDQVMHIISSLSDIDHRSLRSIVSWQVLHGLELFFGHRNIIFF